LNIAPRGSKQGVFAALTHTEKNAVKNENKFHKLKQVAELSEFDSMRDFQGI